jgi:hypothetical protein
LLRRLREEQPIYWNDANGGWIMTRRRRSPIGVIAEILGVAPADRIAPGPAADPPANRDPAYFDDPDTFDIRRRNNRHMAFGQGVHFCVGAVVARTEAFVVIGTVIRRLKDMRLLVCVIWPARSSSNPHSIVSPGRFALAIQGDGVMRSFGYVDTDEDIGAVMLLKLTHGCS